MVKDQGWLIQNLGPPFARKKTRHLPGLQLISTSYLPILNLSQSELRHQRRLELDVQVSSRSIRRYCGLEVKE